MRARTFAALASLTLGLLSWTSGARAAGSQEREPPATTRSLLVGVHPLAPLGGRWGGAVEWLAAPHHALTASVSWIDVAPPCCRISMGVGSPGPVQNRMRGVAVELGYRYYSIGDRFAGLFVAPALALFRGGGTVSDEPVSAIGQIGAAVDVGAQALLFDRVTLGGGVGVQAMIADREIDTGFDSLGIALFSPGARYIRSHVGPRLLLTVGFAF